MFSLRPPQKKAINKIVTGFVVGAEKQERLAGNGFQNAARYQLFLGTHIMIQGLDSHNATRLPTPGIVTNSDRRLGVYTYSQGFGIRIGLCIHSPDIFKDHLGFCCFF
jgi:hypothetical protein